jgi:hypothetical protein
MAVEITPITSEALQAVIRRLLPSQRGFGDDLQATNLITPIIDLTPTAEGSSIPTSLQQAASFDNSHTAVSGGTATAISNTGFFICDFVLTTRNGGTSGVQARVFIDDGSSEAVLFQFDEQQPTTGIAVFQRVVALGTGQLLKLDSSDSDMVISCSSRQVATLDGVLQNPTVLVIQ